MQTHAENKETEEDAEQMQNELKEAFRLYDKEGEPFNEHFAWQLNDTCRGR